MSESSESSSPLLEEGQYTGKVYWLNLPTEYELHLQNLREDLEDRSFQKDISEQYGESNIIIPDVFKENGRLVKNTSISDVSIVNTESDSDIIVGEIVTDTIGSIRYRDNEILILDTKEAKFLIFEYEGYSYLANLAKREVAEGIITILRAGYDELGSTINPTRIGPEEIDEVRKSLDAKVMDTNFTDYPQDEINSIQIRGYGVEEDEEFKRQKRKGKIETHMFQTDTISPDDFKTIEISGDGLVRIYSKSNISTYLRLLTKHVLPHIHRDSELSPSVEVYEELSSFEDNPIYVKSG